MSGRRPCRFANKREGRGAGSGSRDADVDTRAAQAVEHHQRRRVTPGRGLGQLNKSRAGKPRPDSPTCLSYLPSRSESPGVARSTASLKRRHASREACFARSHCRSRTPAVSAPAAVKVRLDIIEGAVGIASEGIHAIPVGRTIVVVTRSTHVRAARIIVAPIPVFGCRVDGLRNALSCQGTDRCAATAPTAAPTGPVIPPTAAPAAAPPAMPPAAPPTTAPVPLAPG